MAGIVPRWGWTSARYPVSNGMEAGNGPRRKAMTGRAKPALIQLGWQQLAIVVAGVVLVLLAAAVVLLPPLFD